MSFHNGRIFLALFDSLKEMELPFHFGGGTVPSPSIINGVTEDGEPCTLVDTFQTASQFHLGAFDVRKEVYSANHLFIGKMFRTTEEVRFSSLLVSYTCLEEWLSYARTFETDPRAKTATFSWPPGFEVRVDAIRAKASLDGAFHTGGDSFRSLNWEYCALIKFTPDEEIGYECYLEMASSFCNLLTLLVGEPVYPKRVEARGEDVEIGGGQMMKEAIQMFVNAGEKDRTPASIHPLQMIIPFSIVRDRIGDILNRWFVRSRDLKPAPELFFSAIRRPSPYLATLLLDLVRAFECFHRFKYDATYVSTEEYAGYSAKIAESFPDSMPSDLKTSLKSRLKYGNEYSLRKRFQEACNELGPELMCLVATDVKAFINGVVDTRNYYIHHDKELEPTALRGRPLFHATCRLRVMLMILWLREVGIEDQTILARLPESNFYSALRLGQTG